ncbi:MAG: Metalloprotease TldD [Gammaproteobacteria bacterium]|nr:MAG: Metalloprotease TldD [Gammaproteobacteria bacterium]|tara:strand:+ start:1331 stop:2761 length:1431 start_codon:yes stop_codon:yes gene_type:complete
MNNIQNLILDSHDLTNVKLEKLLSAACPKNIDFADIYFQYINSESWVLEDGIVKSGSSNIDSGVGIRSVSGDKSGFAYSNDFNFDNLITAANMSKCIVEHGQSRTIKIGEEKKIKRLYESVSPLDYGKDETKVLFLKNIDKYIRDKDSRVDQVIVNLVGVYDSVFVLNTDGVNVFDDRPLVRFSVMVILKVGERRESGSAGGGGRYSYDQVIDSKFGYNFADEALRQASVNLKAIDAKAGAMTVVLGPGWPGVLLHEAIGHGLEGDFNRKKTSAFSDLIGEKVASDQCTIVDDGTISKRRGSLSVDDEGCETKCNTLIENGILKGYMQDKMNSKLMKTSPTGNGRRESYSCLPMPRMTNTFMLPGNYESNEIIESVQDGIYAVNFSGGQVDITNGQFVFTASEAYLIEKGKITSPIKGMTLIGNGPEVLKKVSMVGNDLKLDDGVGTCGKEGQSVPVGVGQPTLKIDEITVGGTQV